MTFWEEKDVLDSIRVDFIDMRVYILLKNLNKQGFYKHYFIA